MSLKAKVEAIIYATEEPVTLDQLASLLGDLALAELRAEEAAVSEPPTPGPRFFDGQQLSSDDLSKEQKATRDKAVKARLRCVIDALTADYAAADRGMEIRQVAGGYRMATKPEHHDVVVNFAKSLKPPVRLSLQALETLSVIAYKQPVTVPEISEIRGVDSSGVIATLLDRKLVTTAGRKQVIGRPILYQHDQGISVALRTERRLRAAQHGRVREAGRASDRNVRSAGYDGAGRACRYRIQRGRRKSLTFAS